MSRRTDIRAALLAALRTITTPAYGTAVREVYEGRRIPGEPRYPAIMVADDTETIDASTLGSWNCELRFTLAVAVQAANEVDALSALDVLCDDVIACIKANRTLGLVANAACDAAVVSVETDREVGDQAMAYADIVVLVKHRRT